MKQSSASNETLGKRLTKAREALSLSCTEIACKLNLHTQIIMALEEDDFQQLPAPIYVRGYIRNYAKIVNLDANELIKIYENMAFEAPKILPDVKPPSVQQVGRKGSWVTMGTYMLTFTLLVLFIIGWRGQYIVNNDVIDDVVTDVVTDVGSGAAIKVVDDVDNTDLGSHDTEDVAVESIVDNDQVEQVEQVDDSASETILTGDLSLLEMELSGESWIEVYDALGEPLYRGLATPEETIRLTGYAPFSVKLGKMQAVAVYFNGEFFDTTDHGDADIADFVLE